jgi:hypothetical protein
MWPARARPVRPEAARAGEGSERVMVGRAAVGEMEAVAAVAMEAAAAEAGAKRVGRTRGTATAPGPWALAEALPIGEREALGLLATEQAAAAWEGGGGGVGPTVQVVAACQGPWAWGTATTEGEDTERTLGAAQGTERTSGIGKQAVALGTAKTAVEPGTAKMAVALGIGKRKALEGIEKRKQAL